MSSSSSLSKSDISNLISKISNYINYNIKKFVIEVNKIIIDYDTSIIDRTSFTESEKKTEKINIKKIIKENKSKITESINIINELLELLEDVNGNKTEEREILVNIQEDIKILYDLVNKYKYLSTLNFKKIQSPELIGIIDEIIEKYEIKIRYGYILLNIGNYISGKELVNQESISFSSKSSIKSNDSIKSDYKKLIKLIFDYSYFLDYNYEKILNYIQLKEKDKVNSLSNKTTMEKKRISIEIDKEKLRRFNIIKKYINTYIKYGKELKKTLLLPIFIKKILKIFEKLNKTFVNDVSLILFKNLIIPIKLSDKWYLKIINDYENMIMIFSKLFYSLNEKLKEYSSKYKEIRDKKYSYYSYTESQPVKLKSSKSVSIRYIKKLQ